MMNAMNTPKFLNSSLRQVCFAGASLLAGAALLGCAHTHPRLLKTEANLQLYSVREQMAKDVPGTLAEIHSWGVKCVEGGGTYGMTPDQYKALLAKNGLKEVAGQFSFAELSTDPEGMARRAHEMGWEYFGTSWIPHGTNDFDEAACRLAIGVFNRAGEAGAKYHVQFFYHPHGYEFQPYRDGTLFDLLMRETNPKTVKYEMDIFWIAHPGLDPAKMLLKYPDRWKLMHLKDMRKGTPTGLLTARSSGTNNVTIGTGILDIPGILRAAQQVGVKWYFIEDESPVSEQQIPQSLAYLRGLRE